MNAQSRVFEEKLVYEGIPYRIIGAINFYARKEIKDLLCYLKTISWMRVSNVYVSSRSLFRNSSIRLTKDVILALARPV